MRRDARDLALEHLAESECELLDRLAAVEAERNMYRDMLQLALEQLYALNTAYHQRRRRPADTSEAA